MERVLGQSSDWQQQSKFGKEQDAHGSVWECPDLFPLSLAGADAQKWVFFISINLGAPNGALAPNVLLEILTEKLLPLIKQKLFG